MLELTLPRCGDDYRDALVLAAHLHRNQFHIRAQGELAGPPTPYIAHLLEVSALVWSDGGEEPAAIAGLLHDALEDQGDQIDAQGLQDQFGPDVRRLVEACTDGAPGLPRNAIWSARKGPTCSTC